MYYNKEERRKEKEMALKRELLNLIPVTVLILIIVIGALLIVHFTDNSKELEILDVNEYSGSKDIVKLENDDLLFEMDPMTTHFTVTNKKSGEIWYSNPKNVDADPLSLPSEKNYIKSTLIINYSDQKGSENKYNNYEFCISGKSYDIITEDNKVRVKYSIGKIQREYIIPTICFGDRFEELISKMNKNDANGVKDYYKKYDFNKLSAKDEERREELLKKCPEWEEIGVIYVLRDNVKDNLKTKFEKFFLGAGYTEEEYIYDKEHYAGEAAQDKPVFNVEIDYSLEGNDLKVNVPISEIEYKKSYPIVSLMVLPYFGAGTWEEEGSMLIPEGGGSLINFNNGKTNQSAYYANVYGWDYATRRDSLVHETRVSYGVFGVRKNDDSFICILGDGAGYASIRADVAGKTSGYNIVYADYSILHREEVDVAARMNGKMYLYEQRIPDENLKMTYRFVDSAEIIDMSKAYNDYLKETLGDTFTLNKDSDVPVAVEILGAVDKVEQVLGVPVSRPLALTTYKEAEGLIGRIKNVGISNLSVKLSGWVNGGINQKMLTRTKLVHRLGSKKDFNDLINYTKEAGVPLYLDAVTEYEYDTNIFEGFFVYTDAACYANKKRAQLTTFSPIYFGGEDGDDYFLLKPSIIVKMMENIKKYALKNGAYGVSFRDVGFQVSSDFKKKAPVSRQAARDMQMAELMNIKDSGLGIMTNVGNDYVFGISDYITNMDLNGFDYSIIDEEVPFLFLAIHGYTNYSGEALNITSNVDEELLKSVECGAGLSFVFMDEDAQSLQDTLYSEYFGASYDSWSTRFEEICRRYSSELGHTFNQGIDDWQRLSDGVTVTVYEDGTKAYVNYGYSDYTTSRGLTIPARDYVVER